MGQQAAYTRLTDRARALGQDLRRVSFFAGTEQGARFEALKAEALTLLDGKVLPELNASLELPLFVAVLGGTNTGKSTFFNALAGLLLSETKVTAGATKHPLVYVHKRWEERLLSGQVFDRIRCLRCDNPAQAIIATAEPQMLFAFHERKELEEFAFIDSPDFDSVEPRNRDIAHLVLTQADVCVFLTTPQKYKDRVLVEDLDAIARQQKRCVAVFNFVDDDMIYRTMVEDLRPRVGEGKGIDFGGYLPQVDTRHPERKLEPKVREIVDGLLKGLSREAIKRETLKATVDSLCAKVRQLIDGSRAEAGHKGAVLEALQREAARAVEGYRQGYQLDFPELGEALRRRLARLELKALLPSQPGGSGPPRALSLLYHALGLSGGAIGSLFASSLEAERAPADWESHKQRRNRQDLVQTQQLAQLLRSRLDSHLRGAAPTSALCLALLRDFFTQEALGRFDAEVESAYGRRLETDREIGDTLLERSSREGSRLPALAANTVKLACGLGLASATNGFGLWDLLFIPLGFAGGGYGITLAMYGLLKRQRSLQQEQRERWFREVVGEVLVEPLRARVETTASEDDLTKLDEHVAAIAALNA